MPSIEVIPVLVATLAAFVVSGAWYAALGDRLVTAGDQAMSAGLAAVELGRSLAVAVVVAGLVSQAQIESAAGAVALGIALAIAFPVVLLVGAVVHEHADRGNALIHAGDWLAKLLAVALIITLL